MNFDLATLIIGLFCIGFSLGASIYILLYWSVPEEKWTNIMPRIFVVFTLTIIYMIQLLVPIDVAIADFQPGKATTVMKIVWEAIVYTVISLLFGVLPFAYFYSEGRELGGTCVKTFVLSFLKVLSVAVLLFMVAAVLWYTVGFTLLPTTLRSSVTLGGVAPYSAQTALGNVDTLIPAPIVMPTDLNIHVNYYTYLTTFLNFVGSILFIAFLSVGLFILPLDFVMAFVRRPRVMTTARLVEFKKDYTERSLALLDLFDTIYVVLRQNFPGADLLAMMQNSDPGLWTKRSTKRLRPQYEALTRATEEITKDYDAVIAMNMKKTANPLKYYLMLVFGIFLFLVSLLWYIQIIAEQGFHYPLVSYAFTDLNKAIGMPVLSIAFYGALTLYLTFCFVKGVTKFGFRFVFFISIHPMERNNTPIYAFIFNLMLMLICALPCVQFCLNLFRGFTMGSAAYALFGSSATFMRGLTWWFVNDNWFLIGLAPAALLVWLLIPPKTVEQKVGAKKFKDTAVTKFIAQMRKKEANKEKLQQRLAKKSGSLEGDDKKPPLDAKSVGTGLALSALKSVFKS